MLGPLLLAVAFDCVPPNVLVVLDRSGSMDNELPSNERKWDVAVDAISSLVLAFDDRIRFGIGTFPEGDNNCETGRLRLPVADAGGAAVATYVQMDAPEGDGTPIAASLTAITAEEAALRDSTRENFVLLVTDGAENCDGMPATAVGGLMGRTPMVRTFVVGFGDGVDEGELNGMADAGGTARMGDPRYYRADDPLALEQALNEIATAVTGGDPEFATCDEGGGDGTGGDDGVDNGGSGGGAGGGAGDGMIGETPSACGCRTGERGGGAGGGGGLAVGLLAFALLGARRMIRAHAR